MGTTIGAAVSWIVAKNRYKTLAEEDIKSVREAFKNMVDDGAKGIYTENENLTDKDSKKKYNTIINNNRYSNNNKETEMDKIIRPCVISPEQFGDIEEYDTVTLYYYADGILVDENDSPVDNIDSVIGFDSLKTFGEYEDDSVFVRNDEKKIYYEILKDERKYIDIIKHNIC